MLCPRAISSLFFPIAVLAGCASDPEPTPASFRTPEDIYAQVEKVVLRASTVDVESQYDFKHVEKVTFNGKSVPTEGSVRLHSKSPGKLAVETVLRNPGYSNDRVTSDGARIQFGSRAPLDYPPALEHHMRLLLARAGICANWLFSDLSWAPLMKMRRDELAPWLLVSDITSGGQPDAPFVKYTLKVGVGLARLRKKLSYITTLWYDPESFAPRRRTLEGVWGGRRVLITETYAQFILNGPISDDVFRLRE